jgi:transmembrane sensor
MTYSNYKTDDFLSDDAFTNWVVQAENDAFWQQFLNENPEQHKAIQNARDFIQASQQVAYPTLPPSVKEAIWGNIRENMREQPVLKPVYRWRIWGAVAAFFLLTLGGGAWLFFAKKTPPSVFGDEKGIVKEVKTEFQQRKQVTLPDGSVVTLNAHSDLKVSENWAQVREVWLEGEAFFEITKKENRGGDALKFIVHTPQINVEVLGTAFNVKARRGQTEVVLQSGKVRLTHDQSTTFKALDMQIGERVVVADKTTQVIENQKVETEKIIAWTNGKIIFEDTSLSEVAKAIEDHFGYQVTIADDNLAKLRFTGELLTDTPDVFFTVLAKTLSLKIETKGKAIIMMR